MKYIKKIENLIKPKYGDYVISNGSYYNGSLKQFIENNIGRIISRGYSTYRVTFDNIPSNITNHFYTDSDSGLLFIILRYGDIFVFSDNKEDLEIQLNIKKYNL